VDPDNPPAEANVWGDLVPVFPGQIDWAYLVSPCGSVVAYVPKRLTPTAPPMNLFLVSTADAQVEQFRKNNSPYTIPITGATPSITTIQHAANGIRVNTGAGATVDVDDPDCTLVGGGIAARVVA
jgi:hypothetical protein